MDKVDRAHALIGFVAVAVMAATVYADDRPPAMTSDVDGYTLVRDDVLAELNAAHKNLPACESGLKKAQTDLRAAAANARDLKAAAEDLGAQKRALESHVSDLETVIARYEVYTQNLEGNQGTNWEAVDGTLGLAAGWAVGTAQCVGLAWVFNQPAWGGS